jgi:threonine/homoserine/homoserine lactone efflux protein
MFQYSLSHWTAFLTAVILLTIIPGPDMAYILGQTARKGRRAGFSAMLGIWTGTFMHVVMASVGLSIVLATSAFLFSAVKWAGALYLIWLGIRSVLSKQSSLSTEGAAKQQSTRRIYWQGVMVSTLNPKVAIFFLSFLPQFVVEGAGPYGAQIFLHGILLVVSAAFIEPIVVFTGSKIAAALRTNKNLGLWMDRSLGFLFVMLGIRLAVSD